jgi:hypothetical protein
MVKRAKNRKAKGVFVSARDVGELDRRFKKLDGALRETIKSQRKSAKELELALKNTKKKFVPYFFSGGGGGIPDGK